MNQQVMQEVFKRIDALAAKLGTTAQYLWGVLIKQAIIEGIYNAVYVVIFALIIFLIWKFTAKFRTNEPDADFKDKVEKWRKKAEAYGCSVDFYDKYVQSAPTKAGEEVIMGFIIPSLITFILLIVGSFFFHDAITGLFNPGYAALKDVVSVFK